MTRLTELGREWPAPKRAKLRASLTEADLHDLADPQMLPDDEVEAYLLQQHPQAFQ